MKLLNIDTGAKKYPIYIDDNYDGLMQAFKNAGLTGRKACIITDTNVAPLYLDKIKALMNNEFTEVASYIFPAGEISKNINTICDFYKFFVEKQLDRKSFLIALGGGVVGDMCGFAAATYMRGIPFVQIPTTLLAQVDSSVGGKTGIDFMQNKNMVGAFYQPEFVYINSSTLNTLPKREVSAGLAEAVKYGYILDKDFLNYCFDNKEDIKNIKSENIIEVIYKSCEAKAYVVSQDEKENGLRAILNFGHTFGHAVETKSDFTMLHGECVAVGMIAALYYSYEKGYVSMEDIQKAESLLSYWNLPIKISDFSKEDIYNQMFYDKKTKNGKLNIVALNKIGEAYIDKNVAADEVKSSIDYIVGE